MRETDTGQRFELFIQEGGDLRAAEAIGQAREAAQIEDPNVGLDAGPAAGASEHGAERRLDLAATPLLSVGGVAAGAQIGLFGQDRDPVGQAGDGWRRRLEHGAQRR